MSGFEMQRLGILMEPAGNTHEVEGVLNPAAARSPDGELYRFPRFVARGITRVSALREYVSIKLAIPQAPTGSASHWSRKPIMSGGPMAAEDAKTLVSPSWIHCSAT